MLKKVFTTLAVAVALVMTGGIANAAQAPNVYHGPKAKPRWMTTKCQSEDDWNCYWNARTMGNGRGHSYWVIPLKGGDVAVVYWNKRYNMTHGHVSGR